MLGWNLKAFFFVATKSLNVSSKGIPMTIITKSNTKKLMTQNCNAKGKVSESILCKNTVKTFWHHRITLNSSISPYYGAIRTHTIATERKCVPTLVCELAKQEHKHTFSSAASAINHGTGEGHPTSHTHRTSAGSVTPHKLHKSSGLCQDY